MDKAREPIPAIAFDPAYALPAARAALAFPEGDADASSIHDWQTSARAKLRELLAADLPTGKPSARAAGGTERDGVAIEYLVLAQSDGQESPAFLLLPPAAQGATTRRRAGIVVLAGHSAGIVATAGFVQDYQHANALALARAGYVVLTVEIRGFGYLARMGVPPDGVDMMSHPAYALQIGKTALGLAAQDVAGGISYLGTRPEVDGERIGLVGFSSGGKTAIYVAALDPRVKVVVASGCVTSHEANFRYARHDSYEVLPEMGKWLRFCDAMGLVAPRPMLVHWGELDNEPWTRCAAYNHDSLPEFERAKGIYTAAGAAAALSSVITAGLGHEFDNEAAIRFLATHLPPESP